MRVALVLALAAVALREPDAPVGETVDGADVDAVRADHFHVLGDLVRDHLVSPCGFAEFAGAARPPPRGGPQIAVACPPESARTLGKHFTTHMQSRRARRRDRDRR